MLDSPFRLIRASDHDAVADAFEALATGIQHRDQCGRILYAGCHDRRRALRARVHETDIGLVKVAIQ